MADFKKILIANRGEIAIRVMRAANELGKRTVAVYAEEDKLCLHRFKADEAYRIGEGLGPVAAYLSIEEIIRVAKAWARMRSTPATACCPKTPISWTPATAAGMTFIGPRAKPCARLGDKASARQRRDRRRRAGHSRHRRAGRRHGLDRQAGQGGRLSLDAQGVLGRRRARDAADQRPRRAGEKSLEGRREAEAAFGNGEGYLEKMIIKARHVEVQILGDKHGAIYHLWERDCSVQRRNQKVVERAPAPYLIRRAREKSANWARRSASMSDTNAPGTVEFLMDMDDGEFYFIEVNPRVQVEHTVTEEVTGIDIVRAQILIAEGKSLVEATGTASQYDVQLDGHALQCRITTEDPQNNFIPDYGRITTYRRPRAWASVWTAAPPIPAR